MTEQIKMELLRQDISLRVEENTNKSHVDITLLHRSDGTITTEEEPIRIDFGFGEKGDSPVKGVDYWTDQDKKEMAREIREELKEDLEQLELPITEDQRMIRVNYSYTMVPDIKMLLEDGTKVECNVRYGENYAIVRWDEAIKGVLLIN